MINPCWLEAIANWEDHWSVPSSACYGWCTGLMYGWCCASKIFTIFFPLLFSPFMLFVIRCNLHSSTFSTMSHATTLISMNYRYHSLCSSLNSITFLQWAGFWVLLSRSDFWCLHEKTWNINASILSALVVTYVIWIPRRRIPVGLCTLIDCYTAALIRMFNNYKLWIFDSMLHRLAKHYHQYKGSWRILNGERIKVRLMLLVFRE